MLSVQPSLYDHVSKDILFPLEGLLDYPNLFAQALHQAQDAVLITDADLDTPGPRILYANLAFLRLTGYEEADLIGHTPRVLQGPRTDRAVLDKLRLCLSAGQPFTGTVVNYHKDGFPFEIEWHASPVINDDGKITHFLSIHRDVTARTRFEQEIEHYIQQLLDKQSEQAARQHELEQANNRLRTLATTDGLTGLYNHRHFHETLAKMLSTEPLVSLVLLDVDHFKAFNDTFGHPMGDILLHAVAQTILTTIRSDDVAARYGGEEFAILLPNQDEDHALAIAERIRAAIEVTRHQQHTVTVSVGVSTVKAQPGAEHILVEQADSAMYAAKAHGRNRVRHYRHLHRSAPARTASKIQCAPSHGECLRCDGVVGGRHGHRSQPGAALLLGPQDKDSNATLRQVLWAAGFTWNEIGSILVIPDVRRRLGEIGTLLKDRLSPYVRSGIRAAYAPNGVETSEQALDAFLFAEPLAKMIEHAEHEWVREALAEDWLFSVFHPIVDAKTGEVFAQEALLRARDPQGDQIIGAGQIINACAALNLQHQLDQRARQAAIRGGALHVPTHQGLFINFLPNTIYDPEICLRTTMETAAAYNMPLSRLTFEVVETENIPDLDHLRRILDYYRARGIATAVDDMGAGYTSEAYLSALRPDYVKIDRELVADAVQNTTARQKFDRIVHAARMLGVQVIAEGIENQMQLALCQDVGVDYLQGFLFANPSCPPSPVKLMTELEVTP